MIAVLVVGFWWPLGSYWQSDDFIAMHYTQSAARALDDFVGAQYGVPALVLFYRPLITLSFVFDGLFGDYAPFVAHLSNTVSHGLSAMILAAIVWRFSTADHAWASGLVWGLAPCHASSVFWAVGRVDSHTTLWIMLAVLLLVQWCRGERQSRLWSLVCFVLGLCSKELALVVPGIVVVLCLVSAQPGRRWPGVLHGSWPYLVVSCVYLGWRWLLFGELGGYEAVIEWGRTLFGFAYRTAQLLNPLLYGGTDYAAEHGFSLPAWFYSLGFVPPVVAVVAVLVRRQQAMLAVLAVLFVGCSVPIVQIMADTGNPKNLRNFYLPMAPLAVLLAAWGWRSALPVLAIAVLPFFALRADYLASWQRCAAWHHQIRTQVTRPDLRLNFVAGLPRENRKATTLEFDQGVDRLLQPPWGRGEQRVFALRPMVQSSGVYTIPYGTAAALPFAPTLAGTFVGGQDHLRRLDATEPLRPLEWEWRGPTELSLAVLDQMVRNFKDPQNSRHQDPEILVRGVRSRVFRVSVFCAGGYLTTFIADSARPDATDGRIEVSALFPAPVAADGHIAARPLRVSTALDLINRFPILIEADQRPDFSGEKADFRATHANRTPAWLHLDRRFAAWWPLN